MFRIAINKLFESLFYRVLASHRIGLGSIPGRDMSVLGPLVRDEDCLGQVSSVFNFFLSVMLAGDESDEHTEHVAGGSASCTGGLASRGGLPAPGNRSICKYFFRIRNPELPVQIWIQEAN